MCQLKIVWCDFLQVLIENLRICILTFSLLLGELKKVSIDEVGTLLQLTSYFTGKFLVYLCILRQLNL